MNAHPARLRHVAWVLVMLQVLPPSSGAQDEGSPLGEHWSVSVTNFSEARGIDVNQGGSVRTLYHPNPVQCAQLDAAEIKVIADLILKVDLPPLVRRQDWTKPGDESVLTLTVSVPRRLKTTAVSITNYVLRLPAPGAESPAGLLADAERLTRKVWDLRSITSEAACPPP